MGPIYNTKMIRTTKGLTKSVYYQAQKSSTISNLIRGTVRTVEKLRHDGYTNSDFWHTKQVKRRPAASPSWLDDGDVD